MAQQQLRDVHRLDKVDPVWKRIRDEAEEVARREPELASFIYSSILHHDTFEQAVVHRIAERLDHSDVSGELIRQAYADALPDRIALVEPMGVLELLLGHECLYPDGRAVYHS